MNGALTDNKSSRFTLSAFGVAMAKFLVTREFKEPLKYNGMYNIGRIGDTVATDSVVMEDQTMPSIPNPVLESE